MVKIGRIVDAPKLSNCLQELTTIAEKLRVATSTLEAIAKPKVGPDVDWTEEEVYKWRSTWYNKHETMARNALKEIEDDLGS